MNFLHQVYWCQAHHHHKFILTNRSFKTIVLLYLIAILILFQSYNLINHIFALSYLSIIFLNAIFFNKLALYLGYLTQPALDQNNYTINFHLSCNIPRLPFKNFFHMPSRIFIIRFIIWSDRFFNFSIMIFHNPFIKTTCPMCLFRYS